jgi:hypothetical protein
MLKSMVFCVFSICFCSDATFCSHEKKRLPSVDEPPVFVKKIIEDRRELAKSCTLPLKTIQKR